MKASKLLFEIYSKTGWDYYIMILKRDKKDKQVNDVIIRGADCYLQCDLRLKISPVKFPPKRETTRNR
ncbi:MAG: hypothetical protein PHE15_03840 [Dehalococcoidales bacterium]|nr:hypothetical protein [Dehalococcoidales bacterium]